MTRRMQAARKKMLGLHAGDISLAAIVRSPLITHDVNAVPVNAIEEPVNNKSEAVTQEQCKGEQVTDRYIAASPAI